MCVFRDNSRNKGKNWFLHSWVDQTWAELTGFNNVMCRRPVRWFTFSQSGISMFTCTQIFLPYFSEYDSIHCSFSELSSIWFRHVGHVDSMFWNLYLSWDFYSSLQQAIAIRTCSHKWHADHKMGQDAFLVRRRNALIFYSSFLKNLHIKRF